MRVWRRLIESRDHKLLLYLKRYQDLKNRRLTDNLKKIAFSKRKRLKNWIESGSKQNNIQESDEFEQKKMTNFSTIWRFQRSELKLKNHFQRFGDFNANNYTRKMITISIIAISFYKKMTNFEPKEKSNYGDFNASK